MIINKIITVVVIKIAILTICRNSIKMNAGGATMSTGLLGYNISKFY